MEEKDIKETELQEQEHHHHEEDCCCHDHDHEHDHHGHDHDHDHEHEHHHHHDHEEECDCHDHEHHHHHHDHDHDHEHHHHDHGHQYEVPGFRILETHNHEGATICSFEKDVKKAPETVIQNMQSAIQTLEKWLDETDATIGHVKGYVKEAGPVTTFSTVGYGLNVEKHDSDTLCVGFASIVFGPEEEELKDKVVEIFASI